MTTPSSVHSMVLNIGTSCYWKRPLGRNRRRIGQYPARTMADSPQQAWRGMPVVKGSGYVESAVQNSLTGQQLERISTRKGAILDECLMTPERSLSCPVRDGRGSVFIWRV